MSLEFEYRELAAACLDLAKRAAALADKTRLLAIAEAWLDLADRVGRNRAKGTRSIIGPAEHARADSTFGDNKTAPAAASPGGHSDTEHFDTGM